MTVHNPPLFFKEFLRTPHKIGAICPSSHFLTKAVCSMLPRNRKGIVLEIGSGTGAITKGLSKVLPPEELLLLERSSRLCTYLQLKYPQLKVINADAINLDKHLSPSLHIDAIVSSMPLLTIPRDNRMEILMQFRSAMSKGSRLVFISYNMFCNEDIVHAGFSSRYHKVVFANIPPARIDCFLPV